MRLSDGRCRQPKAVYLDHRLPPSLAGVATPSLQPIVRWLHISQALDDKAAQNNQPTTQACQNQKHRDPQSNAASAAEAIKPFVVQNDVSEPFEKCPGGQAHCEKG